MNVTGEPMAVTPGSSFAYEPGRRAPRWLVFLLPITAAFVPLAVLLRMTFGLLKRTLEVMAR